MKRNLGPAILLALGLAGSTWAQDTLPRYLEQEPVPALKYHLTARPWQPIGGDGGYLDMVEATARFFVGLQEPSGRIPPPIKEEAEEYRSSATPELSPIRLGHIPYQIGILYQAGRAKDLLDAGIRAMDFETERYHHYIELGGDLPPNAWQAVTFAEGLGFAFEVLSSIPAIPESKKDLWRGRLFVSDRARQWLLAHGGSPNSFCYRMQTEWNRLRLGIVSDHAAVVDTIERVWRSKYNGRGGVAGQRHLIVPTRWNLYKDMLTDPDSLSTEAAGRVNLLLLAHQGYDGPSAAEIRTVAERGACTLLLLQDPTGQTPPNGRTENHNFADAANAAAMEAMAEEVNRQGDAWRAGQFRRSAMLSMESIRRFRRPNGTFAITKNQFDPSLRVGHQGGFHSEYIAKVATHIAEAYQLRQTKIDEQPAPAEIGGYALTLDPAHSVAVANAGGMMMQVNLRGETKNLHTKYPAYDCHTPLGVVRFGRAGWDTRLGPGDGVQNFTRTKGISFAPTFLEGDTWARLADIPSRYKARFTVQLAHPLLVRCVVEYSGDGPGFRNEFVITPDGILSITKGSGTWGMTVPLLTFDGAQRLDHGIAGRIARTSFGSDEQNFIALHSSATLSEDGAAMRNGYGDILPVRIAAADDECRIFVYPRNPTDPKAETVRASFKYETPARFSSTLGRVDGDTYVGRSAAGGVADRIDINGDGKPEATFSKRCGFVLQLRAGRVTMVEADQDVEVEIGGRRLKLSAYGPQSVIEKLSAGQ